MASLSEQRTGRVRFRVHVTRDGRSRIRPPALLGLLVLLAAASPARSASFAPFDPSGRDRIQAELERTDQVLLRATESLRDCASPKAKVLLREARELQRKAADLYVASGPTLPSSRILLLTRRARELAVDAIEQCQVEFKAHEALRSMLDSTSALLQEAQSAVAASSDIEARRLLEAGIWQLDRAREAYRAGEYRRAILLGGAARNLVQRARDRARGAVDDAGPGSRLDAALDRTDALLAEVRGVAGLREDARALALLEKAEREQEQARTLRERGVPVAALRRTQSARASAMDALWRVQRAPDPQQLRDAADMVGRLLDQASPEIRASGSEEALGLLDKAAEQLQVARAELAGGNAERAAKAIRTADSLLRRAAEKAAR